MVEAPYARRREHHVNAVGRPGRRRRVDPRPFQLERDVLGRVDGVGAGDVELHAEVRVPRIEFAGAAGGGGGVDSWEGVRGRNVGAEQRE